MTKKIEGLEIRQISYEETKDLILNVHYARRIPSISLPTVYLNIIKLLALSLTDHRPPFSMQRDLRS